MNASELAGMLVREVDAGVAEALAAFDAAGALSVDKVVARVGPTPDDNTALDDVVWQAEVHMRPTGVASRESLSRRGMAKRIADLPVTAIRGVGSWWAQRLAAAQLDTIGALAGADATVVTRLIADHGVRAAVFVGRARSVTAPWPAALAIDIDLSELVDRGPAALFGVTDESHANDWWVRSLETMAALDDDVVASLTVHSAPGR